MIIHWFRADLRFWDNHALFQALNLARNKTQDLKFLWIWDEVITSSFNPDNAKMKFLNDRLKFLKSEIKKTRG